MLVIRAIERSFQAVTDSGVEATSDAVEEAAAEGHEKIIKLLLADLFVTLVVQK